MASKGKRRTPDEVRTAVYEAKRLIEDEKMAPAEACEKAGIFGTQYYEYRKKLIAAGQWDTGSGTTTPLTPTGRAKRKYNVKKKVKTSKVEHHTFHVGASNVDPRLLAAVEGQARAVLNLVEIMRGTNV